MEPPLFTADNKEASIDATHEITASMEPPLFTADNQRVGGRRGEHRAGFNGAAVIHGG